MDQTNEVSNKYRNQKFKSNHINQFNTNKVLNITISNVIDLINVNEEENTTNYL